jgi:hypothetical protein
MSAVRHWRRRPEHDTPQLKYQLPTPDAGDLEDISVREPFDGK